MQANLDKVIEGTGGGTYRHDRWHVSFQTKNLLFIVYYFGYWRFTHPERLWLSLFFLSALIDMTRE